MALHKVLRRALGRAGLVRRTVRGRIHSSKWTDREGVERYGCEIIAEDVQFLSSGKSASGGEPSGQNDIDDDLPF